MNEIKSKKVIISVTALVAIMAGGVGYSLSPSSPGSPDSTLSRTLNEIVLPDNCYVVISGNEIPCEEAASDLQSLARVLKDKDMLLKRQQRGIICYSNGGEYLPSEDSCSIGGENWKWNGKTFEIARYETLSF